MKKMNVVLIGLVFLAGTTRAYVFNCVNKTDEELKLQIQLSADTKTYEMTVAAGQASEFNFAPFRGDAEHWIRAGFCLERITTWKNGAWHRIPIYEVRTMRGIYNSTIVRNKLHTILIDGATLHAEGKDVEALRAVRQLVNETPLLYKMGGTEAVKLNGLQEFSLRKLSDILRFTRLNSENSLFLCRDLTFTFVKDADGVCAVVLM
jgi:hypothetical protein